MKTKNIQFEWYNTIPNNVHLVDPIWVTQLVHSISLKFLLAKKQYLLSLNPYSSSRISMFLALLYVMDLATAMSIQLDLSHRSPNNIQLMCPYLTHTSEYLPTDVPILKTIHWIAKTIFWYLTKYSSLWLNGSIQAATSLHRHWYLCTSHIPDLLTAPLYTCPKYKNRACNIRYTHKSDLDSLNLNIIAPPRRNCRQHPACSVHHCFHPPLTLMREIINDNPYLRTSPYWLHTTYNENSLNKYYFDLLGDFVKNGGQEKQTIIPPAFIRCCKSSRLRMRQAVW